MKDRIQAITTPVDEAICSVPIVQIAYLQPVSCEEAKRVFSVPFLLLGRFVMLAAWSDK